MSLPSTPTREAVAPYVEPGPIPTVPAEAGVVARRWTWRSTEWALAVTVTLAAAILPAVLWPGEISWINDEPRLIAKAFHANAAGTLADRGLRGNFGISYGPVATHIYQAMLLVTHDPIVLARLRAGLCAGVTALGMLWLARSLRLNPWFAAAVMLAPYLWVFQRILWDASFAIPIGTIALAAYASFLRTRGRWPLLLSLACTLTLPFIHPQDLPLCVPILAHVLWRHRPALRRSWLGVAVVMLGILGLNARYFMLLFSEISYYLAVGLPPSYPGGHSLSSTVLGPVGVDVLVNKVTTAFGGTPAAATGRHLLGGHGYMGEGDGGLGRLVGAGKWGLYVFYPLLWAGIAVSAWRLSWRRRLSTQGALLGPSGAAQSPSGARARWPAPWAAAARDAVAGVALAGVLLQMAMAGAMGVPAEPQYFFGTFVLHAVLAWIAVDALGRFRLTYAAILIYGLSAAAVTLGTMRHYHAPGPPAAFDPASAMPTLGDSVAVVRALEQYPADVEAVTDIDFYHRFPHTLRTLRLLIPPPAADATRDDRPAVGPLVIRHRPAWDGFGPRVEVVDPADFAGTSPPGWPISVAPLPANWEPGKE